MPSEPARCSPLTNAIGDVRQWAENAWNDSLNFADDTLVVIEDGYNDVKIYVDKTANNTFAWMSETGTQVLVYLEDAPPAHSKT